METASVIHENHEQKVEPFWWIFYFIVISVAFLTGVVLIIGPPLLYAIVQSAWLLMLFILIPPGIWIVKKLYPYTKKLIWQNTHLSTYVLRENGIEAEEWNEPFREEPFRRTIDVADIRFVAASSSIVRETYSPRSQGGTGRTYTETVPVLFIVYAKGNEEAILTVPFPQKGRGVDTWLAYFQRRHIPLKYTARLLHRQDMAYATDEQRLAFLQSSENLIDFSFSGDWPTQESEFWEEWMQKDRQRQAEEKTDPPQQESAGTERKRGFRTWGMVTFVLLGFIIIADLVLIKLAEDGILPPENMLPGLAVLFLAGWLYFYLLRSHLRWYDMLMFLVKVFIFNFIVLIPLQEEGQASEEMATGLIADAMLLPFFVWIPYLIVKKLTDRNARP